MNPQSLFAEPSFRLAFGFVMGAILGSFATMLAYRLPRRLSIVLPRSHCPSCNAVLGVRDLVPIFSWIFMRGRCRHCRAKIGAQYLVMEMTSSSSCAIATFFIGFSPLLVVAFAIIVACIVTICDFHTVIPQNFLSRLLQPFARIKQGFRRERKFMRNPISFLCCKKRKSDSG